MIVTLATPALTQDLHRFGSGRKLTVWNDSEEKAEYWINQDLIKVDRKANYDARQLKREREERRNNVRKSKEEAEKKRRDEEEKKKNSEGVRTAADAPCSSTTAENQLPTLVSLKTVTNKNNSNENCP